MRVIRGTLGQTHMLERRLLGDLFHIPNSELSVLRGWSSQMSGLLLPVTHSHSIILHNAVNTSIPEHLSESTSPRLCLETSADRPCVSFVLVSVGKFLSLCFLPLGS